MASIFLIITAAYLLRSRAGSSELPDDTAEVSTTTQNSRIFALVIAIDNYQDHRVRNLRGCVADGEDFSMFLRDTLHVPEDRIVTLYDDNASREGIINAFLGEQGLIHSSNIVKEEPIVIFYAGHGTRGCAPRSWGAEDNQFEGLCPCDITQPVMERPPQEKGTQTDDCRMVYAIPDRTFNSLMQHLAHEKGDNIVSSPPIHFGAASHLCSMLLSNFAAGHYGLLSFWRHDERWPHQRSAMHVRRPRPPNPRGPRQENLVLGCS